MFSFSSNLGFRALDLIQGVRHVYQKGFSLGDMISGVRILRNFVFLLGINTWVAQVVAGKAGEIFASENCFIALNLGLQKQC